MKIRSSRPLMLTAVAATLVVALAGCSETAPLDPEAGPVDVVIATVGAAEYAPAFVAQEEGIFADNGLNAKIEVVQSAAQTVVALQSGSADIAPVATANLLQASANGIDLVIVAGAAVAGSSDVNYALVSGAGLEQPADFVGKAVAVNAIDSFFHVLFREWLYEGGVEADQVTYVQTPLGSMADALSSGTVDGVIAPQPFLATASAVPGANTIYIAEKLGDGYQPFVYAMTREFAEANPKVVEAFRTSLLKAVDIVETSPDTARADFGKYVELPAEVIATTQFNQLTASVTADHIRPWVAMMLRQGMLSSEPDLSSLILG